MGVQANLVCPPIRLPTSAYPNKFRPATSHKFTIAHEPSAVEQGNFVDAFCSYPSVYLPGKIDLPACRVYKLTILRRGLSKF